MTGSNPYDLRCQIYRLDLAKIICQSSIILWSEETNIDIAEEASSMLLFHTWDMVAGHFILPKQLWKKVYALNFEEREQLKNKQVMEQHPQKDNRHNLQVGILKKGF